MFTPGDPSAVRCESARAPNASTAPVTEERAGAHRLAGIGLARSTCRICLGLRSSQSAVKRVTQASRLCADETTMTGTENFSCHAHDHEFRIAMFHVFPETREDKGGKGELVPSPSRIRFWRVSSPADSSEAMPTDLIVASALHVGIPNDGQSSPSRMF